jgi:hypothetical protein
MNKQVEFDHRRRWYQASGKFLFDLMLLFDPPVNERWKNTVQDITCPIGTPNLFFVDNFVDKKYSEAAQFPVRCSRWCGVDGRVLQSVTL